MSAPQQLVFDGELMVFPERTPEPGLDYGEVFTRRWVVNLILDLVGYTAERDLGTLTLVEPSCGTGAFLVPIVERLVESSERHGHDLRSLEGAIRAFDLLDANAARARKAVVSLLRDQGLSQDEAEALADLWVATGDFLLKDHDVASADFVVGNPPYIRLESVPRPTMEAYRQICPTMRGRSDIYVGFIERGLDLLRPGGVLGFICADRWMRNQYGADLRELVSERYAVDTVVAMHDVDAFEDDVSAYPAVVVLKNERQGPAVVAETTAKFGESESKTLGEWIRRPKRRTVTRAAYQASRLDTWFAGRDLWPSGSPAQLALVTDLEARFPPLQDPSTGTRVGIGVATGCDDVYITADDDVVESDRLLPLLQAGDTVDGSADWSGRYLVNPWNGDGLVDLAEYPRLAGYLDAHADRLRGRHVAKKRPHAWYRTIDKVDPELQGRPKLVLPDLKAASHPVLDPGSYYPHHNLYFVVSEQWDLEVLGGLLLSDVANLFVGTYCVRMRGGCYRFQAQYVRRIRVPEIGVVDARAARQLARAFRERDVQQASAAAARLYGIDLAALERAVAVER